MRRRPAPTAPSQTIFEEADIAGALHMGAAAKLGREFLRFFLGTAAHGDDAHFLAVFLAEQRHGAGLDRGVRRHQARRHIRIGADAAVHLMLDPGDIVGRSCALVCEKSKRRRSGATSEPFCVTWLPKAAAQRLVQQMGRRMMRAQARAARVIDLHLDRIAVLHGCPW